MKTKLIKSLVCIGLILSMTFFAFSVSAVEADSTSVPEEVEIVVLNQDVPQGGKILKSYLALRKVKSINVPSNAIYSISEVAGKFAKIHLYGGEYVATGTVSSSTVAPEAKSYLLRRPIVKAAQDFVVVTDYIYNNTGEDITSHLQELINKNPMKTLYFPDGEYIISRPLYTAAIPSKSTTMRFSSGAILKADPETWRSVGDKTALICFGAGEGQGEKDGNNNSANGHYYGLFGGILDGSGVADGVSIDWGRETIINGVYIKDTKVGLTIKTGANSKSSDADIENVTIVGNGKSGTVGLDLIGYDNTVTNVNIYDVQYGVKSTGGGNTYRSVNVFNTLNAEHDIKKLYKSTIGFDAYSGDFYFHCKAVNYAIAMRLEGDTTIIDTFNARWTSAECTEQTAFRATGNTFNVRPSNCIVEFFDDTSKNAVLYTTGTLTNSGRVFDNIIVDRALNKTGYISGDIALLQRGE